jgi:hypothetical protein
MDYLKRIPYKLSWFITMMLFFGISACSQSTSPAPLTANPAMTEIVMPTIPPTVTTSPVPTKTPLPTETPTPTVTMTFEPVGTPQAIMGIQVEDMAQEAQADLFYQSGAVWSRHDYIRWEDLEPENTDPGNYRWESVDEAGLMAAMKDGQKTIVNILFTPAWAQKYPGIACGPIAEDALDDFAEFMGAVVDRYSKPPYNVQYWEIGNEPDIDRKLVTPHSIYGCWGEEDDPYYGGGYYAEMLKAVYPSIKAADPDAKVLVGGLVLDCDPVNPPETSPGSGELRNCTPATFLEGILESGGGDYLDGVSFHAYDYFFGEEGRYGNPGWHSTANTIGPVLSVKVSYLRSLLNSYGYSDKELLNTELAVLCGRDGRESYCQTEAFSNTKAYYIAQANASAFSAGLHTNLWYSLIGWRASGLVGPGLQPNQAYLAYQVAARRFNYTVYKGEITEYAGIKGYQFESENRLTWLLWSLDGEKLIIQLPEEPDAIFDVFGERLEVNPSEVTGVDISTPVYIEWQK